MALIKCPECGKEISKYAKTCPSCGFPLGDCAYDIIINMVDPENELALDAIAKLMGSWATCDDARQKIKDMPFTIATELNEQTTYDICSNLTRFGVSCVCARQNVPSAEYIEQKREKTNIQKFDVWCLGAIASLICGCITLYKGIDKMTNYYNGDYRHVNVYVNGDAYNYIINGTYATAFFVLTAICILTSIGMMIIHYIKRSSK